MKERQVTTLNNAFDNGFEMREIKPNEQVYTYRQSQQLDMQTGLIGYVRADMGSLGNEFFHTWNEYRKDLNTQDFKDELDFVIDTLRKDGNFLADRDTLMRLCYQNIETSYHNGREFGIRVDTPEYAYLMRLNPNKGEYNLYCYCYRKDFLDAHIENASKGIRFVTPQYKEKFVIDDCDKIRVTYEDGRYEDKYCRFIDEYHLEVNDNIYHICEFAEKLMFNNATVIPLRNSLPDKCYYYDKTHNVIGIINKGEPNYDIYSAGNCKIADNYHRVKELNQIDKITAAQTEAMKYGAFHGWDKPEANPANYNEIGVCLILNHPDR